MSEGQGFFSDFLYNLKARKGEVPMAYKTDKRFSIPEEKRVVPPSPKTVPISEYFKDPSQGENTKLIYPEDRNGYFHKADIAKELNCIEADVIGVNYKDFRGRDYIVFYRKSDVLSFGTPSSYEGFLAEMEKNNITEEDFKNKYERFGTDAVQSVTNLKKELVIIFNKSIIIAKKDYK